MASMNSRELSPVESPDPVASHSVRLVPCETSSTRKKSRAKKMVSLINSPKTNNTETTQPSSSQSNSQMPPESSPKPQRRMYAKLIEQLTKDSEESMLEYGLPGETNHFPKHKDGTTCTRGHPGFINRDQHACDFSKCYDCDDQSPHRLVSLLSNPTHYEAPENCKKIRNRKPSTRVLGSVVHQEKAASPTKDMKIYQSLLTGSIYVGNVSKSKPKQNQKPDHQPLTSGEDSQMSEATGPRKELEDPLQTSLDLSQESMEPAAPGSRKNLRPGSTSKSGSGLNGFKIALVPGQRSSGPCEDFPGEDGGVPPVPVPPINIQPDELAEDYAWTTQHRAVFDHKQDGGLCDGIPCNMRPQNPHPSPVRPIIIAPEKDDVQSRSGNSDTRECPIKAETIKPKAEFQPTSMPVKKEENAASPDHCANGKTNSTDAIPSELRKNSCDIDTAGASSSHGDSSCHDDNDTDSGCHSNNGDHRNPKSVPTGVHTVKPKKRLYRSLLSGNLTELDPDQAETNVVDGGDTGGIISEEMLEFIQKKRWKYTLKKFTYLDKSTKSAFRFHLEGEGSSSEVKYVDVVRPGNRDSTETQTKESSTKRTRSSSSESEASIPSAPPPRRATPTATPSSKLEKICQNLWKAKAKDLTDAPKSSAKGKVCCRKWRLTSKKRKRYVAMRDGNTGLTADIKPEEADADNDDYADYDLEQPCEGQEGPIDLSVRRTKMCYEQDELPFASYR